MSIPENHMDMCKFASKDDLGYKRVSDRIEELASSAVDAVRQGTTSQSGAENPQAAPVQQPLLIEQSNSGLSTIGGASVWHGSVSEIEEAESIRST